MLVNLAMTSRLTTATLLACAISLLAAGSQALAQGGCVGRVLLPPTESLRSERVLEAPGGVQRIHLPPRVERSAHKVLVRPAREERIRWAAAYRTVRQTVASPGLVRWTRGPDRYADVTERTLIAPGHYAWERRDGPLVSGPPQPGQTMVTPTGVILCRVWCPARYEVVARRVRVGAGRAVAVHTVHYREVTRRVLVRPAGSAVRRTPALYRWVETTRVVSPGGWSVRRTAARYGWRQQREVHDGGASYAPVVCGGPLSRPAMAHMQSSLAAQGYDPGPQDGLGRPQTYDALRRYQVDHRLAAGQVTVESARALGVIQ